jgi:hypothetical protein
MLLYSCFLCLIGLIIVSFYASKGKRKEEGISGPSGYGDQMQARSLSEPSAAATGGELSPLFHSSERVADTFEAEDTLALESAREVLRESV